VWFEIKAKQRPYRSQASCKPQHADGQCMRLPGRQAEQERAYERIKIH
jgi:hypothetical protein